MAMDASTKDLFSVILTSPAGLSLPGRSLRALCCACKEGREAAGALLLKRRAVWDELFRGYWFYLTIEGHDVCRDDTAETPPFSGAGMHQGVPLKREQTQYRPSPAARERFAAHSIFFSHDDSNISGWDRLVVFPSAEDRDEPSFTLHSDDNFGECPGFEFPNGAPARFTIHACPRDKAEIFAPRDYGWVPLRPEWGTHPDRWSTDEIAKLMTVENQQTCFAWPKPGEQASELKVFTAASAFADNPAAIAAQYLSSEPPGGRAWLTHQWDFVWSLVGDMEGSSARADVGYRASKNMSTRGVHPTLRSRLGELAFEVARRELVLDRVRGGA